MTDIQHDTLTELDRGTPTLFTLAARVLPAGLAAQFLLAGQALFAGMSWGAHIAVGGLIGIPVIALAGYSIAVPRLRGFGWWAGLILLLYVVQIILAASGPAMLAFHPFNAALLLTASLVFLFKVERRRAHHQR